MHYLIVFLMSMVPLIELRGAIPYGLGFDLDPFFTYGLAILGNCLPVPFILFFIKSILSFMQRSRVGFFRRVSTFVTEKAQKNFHKVQKYAVFGLYLFVAIPLPGTGAWTGSLIAALLDMKKRYAFLSIFLGVLTAGVIMWLISFLVKQGIVSGLAFLAPEGV